MLKRIRNHLHNNKGDANISKTMMIAIAFVVGAILLIMVTSAFRNPINTWFSKTNNDWFAEENGDYPINANGTLRNMEYRGKQGPYTIIVTAPEALVDGQSQSVTVERRNAAGQTVDVVTMYGFVAFQDGGSTVSITNGSQRLEVAAESPIIPEE